MSESDDLNSSSKTIASTPITNKRASKADDVIPGSPLQLSEDSSTEYPNTPIKKSKRASAISKDKVAHSPQSSGK